MIYLKRNIGELLVIPKLKAHRASSGNLVLTEKFLDGMNAYAERWPGKVTAMVEVNEQADSNLDHLEVDQKRYPFRVEEAPLDRNKMISRMRLADVALGGITGVSGVRQALVKETTLRTRLQIIKEEAPGNLRRWKRSIAATITDLQERRWAGKLSGVQCNGTPTYEIYRKLNPNAMLFFDSRINSEDLVTDNIMERRTKNLLTGKSLCLAFTGRLMRIKGAGDLPKISSELRQLGVRFKLNICGGGECEQQIAHDIQEDNLADLVHMRGVLKYREELLPLVRENVDLFVCTHVQGDPSCTYLETMACGVPIVGYANEAWKGMAPMSRAGWVTTIKKPELLAAKIAELDQNRPALAQAARAARAFAEQHLFDRTMDRRVEHLLSCLKRPRWSGNGDSFP